MPSQPLRVALLWHQHQPYYKNGNSYLLPWTRLHATKDYYDIAAALESFPRLRQTINIAPSLLVQLIDYVEHDATDRVLELSLRPAADLQEMEKITILRDFFLCNAERMILPYPRFAELYRKGHRHRDDIDGLYTAAATFTTEEWRDLQAWYNLTWIGEYSRDQEPFASLLAKGRDFTEEEKLELIEASKTIIAKVIPTYRRLLESGQVELSVTPFYHPILPILIDSFTALEAMPNASLPEHHINYPEDAEAHVRRAIELFRQQFGRDPAGCWPSEGSVSDAALTMLKGSGIQWGATDEGVLRKTLGEHWNALAKYYPYTFKTRSGPIWMVFRDHELSDAIGFVYSSWDPEAAALDFYNRLVEIRSRIIQEQGARALNDALVSVILDGENCWEYYRENGRPFLEALYKLLDQSNEIETTTIYDAIASSSPHRDRTLGRIYSGSWIGSNFKIWIGHDEDNTAWDALAEARASLMLAKESLPPDTFTEAMEEIYIAEGSDWFWWYGDENSAVNQDDFDELFRLHLRNVYTLIGQMSPPLLDRPIRRAGHRAAVVAPTRAISPTVDGHRSSINEWSGAGFFIVDRVGGAMHRAEAIERRVLFGSDETNFYFRFDTDLPLEAGQGVRICLAGSRSVMLHFTAGSVGIESAADEQGRVRIGGMSAAIGETLEAAIPLDHLDGDGSGPDSVGISCQIFENGHEVERFPHQGEIYCPLIVAEHQT